MGKAGCFRQAITAGAVQYIANTGGQTDSMAGGDVEQMGSRSGAEGGTDGFSLIPQRLPVPPLVPHGGMMSHQAGFGHPNRR